MNKLIKNSKDNALLFRRPLMVGLILGLSFPTAPLTLQAAQKTIQHRHQAQQHANML